MWLKSPEGIDGCSESTEGQGLQWQVSQNLTLADKGLGSSLVDSTGWEGGQVCRIENLKPNLHLTVAPRCLHFLACGLAEPPVSPEHVGGEIGESSSRTPCGRQQGQISIVSLKPFCTF